MGTNQSKNVQLDEKKYALLDQQENFQRNQNQSSGTERKVGFEKTMPDYTVNSVEKEAGMEEIVAEVEQNKEQEQEQDEER